jgi:hypothetical protein
MSAMGQQSTPTFEPVGAGLIGVKGSSSDWGDFDGDGDLDLVVTGQDAGFNETATIYENKGEGKNDSYEPGNGYKYFVTDREYDPDTDDIPSLIDQKYGSEVGLADWSTLVDLYSDDKSGLVSFLDGVGISEDDKAYVRREGDQYWDGDRHYFIKRHNGDVGGNFLVHDHLHSNTLSLGSWYNTEKALVRVPTSSGEAAFSDDFDDGDFTNDPAWSVDNNDDLPGELDVIDDALQILRTNAGGNGGTTGISKTLNIPITQDTRVNYDVKATFSDVSGGAGFGDGEYPISVEVVLQRDDGSMARLRHAYNYRGGANKDEGDFIQIVFPDVEQDTWLRDESFRVREHFPEAETITELRIYGNGWNYEGWADNVSINKSGEGGQNPSVPSDLTATAGDSQIELTWSPGGEESPAGYNVYRSTSSFSDISEATKLNGSLHSRRELHG